MITLLVCLIAGLGAGLGTGLAGLSAAAVISPMLIAFLNMPAYEAIGIALASDVLASAVSSYTYYKNKNIDIKNSLLKKKFEPIKEEGEKSKRKISPVRYCSIVS